MTTPTLSSIAIDVVGQYNQAGQHLARAYQAGVEQAARAINERFAEAVNGRSLPLVNDAVKSSLIEAQQRVSGIVVGGLRARSRALSAVNERIARGATDGIERISGAASRIETAFDADPSGTLALIGMPSAQLSLAIATEVAERAKRLGERVAANDELVDAEPVAAPKQRARRSARRA